MSEDEKVVANKKSTNDKDLVELAGYQAYIHHDKYDKIMVNGKPFVVVDVDYNEPSGFDAVTVINDNTKEVTIVYVGTDPSDKRDIYTDAQLLSSFTPQQIKDSLDYFDAMKKKYGEITSVTGNSLAGANANAVGVKHPDVKVVTLDPALLPKDMMDPNKSYDNITNYFVDYDPLTLTERGGHLDTRIPGKHYQIGFGVADLSLLTGSNHTGYLRNDDGSQDYTVGQPGEPGYGKIDVAADEHIVTSVWTGEPLYDNETSSHRININHDSLMVLANALKNNVIERLGKVREYLDHSVEIVEDESDKYEARIAKLREIYEKYLENAARHPLFTGLASAGNQLSSEITYLISLLDSAESKCKFLNSVLNSPPAELVEHIAHMNLSVESIFGEARQHLNNLKIGIDDLSHPLETILRELIPKLLMGGLDYKDAVVEELRGHYEIINRNKDKVYNQLIDYQLQVCQTAETFQRRDEALGHSIKHKSGTRNSSTTFNQFPGFVFIDMPDTKTLTRGF